MSKVNQLKSGSKKPTYSSFKLTETQKKQIKESSLPYLEIHLTRGMNLPIRDITGEFLNLKIKKQVKVILMFVLNLEMKS
jgi:hypothetical protein